MHFSLNILSVSSLSLLLSSFSSVALQTHQHDGSSLSTFNLTNYLNTTQQDELSLFWSSIEELSTQESAKWQQVADSVLNAIEQLNATGNDAQCYRAIEETFRRGPNNEWSAKMIHSNSFLKRSFVSSLIMEEYTSLGEFDDCLEVTVPWNENHLSLPLTGKYCLVNVTTPTLGFYSETVENAVLQEAGIQATGQQAYLKGLAKSWLGIRNRFPFMHGICVPSLCQAEAIERLISAYFTKFSQGMSIKVDYCQQANLPFDHKPGFFIAVGILAFTGTLATVSTLLNLYFIKPYTSHLPFPTLFHYLSYFDMLTNTLTLTSAKHGDKNNQYDLRFIHGLKAIMIAVMSIGHAFSYINVSLFYKLSTFRKFPSNVVTFLTDDSLGAFWQKAVFMISLFFTISGFLTTYITLIKIRRPPAFAPYVLLRWFFLLPSVIGTLAFTIALQYLGTGPLFHPQITDTYVAPCYTHWWTHLLFINNLWNADQYCGVNLWFISALFQLHILLYPVIVLYFSKKLYAYLGAGFLSTVTFSLFGLFAFGYVGVPLLTAVIGFRAPFPMRALSIVYMYPTLHFFPYFLGVLVALLLVKNTFPKISGFQNTIHSILWGVLLISTLAVHLPSQHAIPEANESFSLLFNSLSILCAVSIGLLNATWFFLTVLSSAQSIVKRTLSLSFFLPLSRLSLGLYLLNPLLIWYNVHLNRVTPSLSIISSTTFGISIYLQSFVLALLLYLLFEAPFGRLINDLTRRSPALAQEKEANCRSAELTQTNGNYPKKASIKGQPQAKEVEMNNNCGSCGNLNCTA